MNELLTVSASTTNLRINKALQTPRITSNGEQWLVCRFNFYLQRKKSVNTATSIPIK